VLNTPLSTPDAVAPLGVTAGVVFAFRKHLGSHRTSAEIYADSLQLCQYVEQIGFDEVWLSEHHGAADEYLPSPLTVAAAVGARTTTLRIGTFALLAPFYHPVRLAEDAAVIDNLTGGRLTLGIGLGYRPEEFLALGVQRSRRAALTEEIIDIVLRCWTEDEFSFEGEFFTLQGVRCVPKPVQQPRIPLWIGGYSIPGSERAGRLGDGWLGTGAKAWPGARDAYLAAADAAGKTTVPPKIVNSDLPLYQFCTRDPDRDCAVIEECVRSERRMVARWQADGNGVALDGDVDLSKELLVATPEDLVEQIRSSYERAPFSKYVLNPLLDAGVPLEMVSSSLRLFAEEVMPSIHAIGRT
jgi:alkanesulfonate monooxygenase SsuD/methylene tetrahydromethanopterin reductase-like flavin-dependent oxidoreductase (luciferase family)